MPDVELPAPQAGLLRTRTQPGPSPRAKDPIPKGERRNVTVVFADLSGYTPLAEKLDPEELTSILQDIFGELKEEVSVQEGWIAKYMGDALLAVFGAPRAHEDDPARAVRAAMGMQLRMREVNRKLGDKLVAPLHIHIGVNTGLVVAGSAEADDEGEEHFTVLGDSVNVAARLQQAAGPDQILVGESAYLATRWAFDYRSLAALELKGKSQRIMAYECLGPRAKPLSQRGLEGMTTPMLGRDAELRELVEAFEAAVEGNPQVVALVGDAGIGKSRLVREFLGHISTRGLLSVERIWSAFAAADRHEPFGLVKSLFTSPLADQTGVEEASELAKLFNPEMADDDESLRYLDAEHRKQRLYLLSNEMLEVKATELPLLLIIEDLHWADEASLDLLRFLAARAAGQKLMLVATYRPELQGPFTTARATVHSIAMAPLADEVTYELLRAYFGESVESFPSEVLEMLIERSEGNPFYLEELIRSLIQQGVLKREERWTVVEPAELTVPDSIQGLLLARMDRLPHQAHVLLQEASVLGLIFPARLLAAFSTVEQTPRHLQELVEGEWLVPILDPESGEISYRFQHTLVREVAYESLLHRARAPLHLRAARVIESLYSDQVEEFSLVLAEHYEHSGSVQQAVTFYELAGDRARSVYANGEAASAFRRASEIVSEERREDRSRLLARLGDALQGSGRFDEAVEAWIRSLEVTDKQLESVDLHRRIAAVLWSKGGVEEADGHLQTGLASLDGNKNSAQAAALYQELANQTLHRGRIEEAVRWARLALDICRELRSYEAAALAETTLGVALARKGEVEEGLREVTSALSLAADNDLPIAAGRARVNLAVLYANVDPMHAAEICDEGLREARRVGDVAIQPWFHATLAGSLHACASDYDTATRSAEVAVEMDRQLGLSSHLPVPLIVLGQIHQCHERYQEAESCFQEALHIAENLNDPQLLFPALEGLGTLYLERGEEAQGRVFMKRAYAVLDEAGFTQEEMVLLPYFL